MRTIAGIARGRQLGRGVLIAAACALLSAPATGDRPSPQLSAWSAQRMALGLRTEDWPGDGSAGHAHARRKSGCSRWRAIASKLGETYAGHLLRQTVVRHQCRFLEADRVDDTWDWPWASLSGGKALPPRRYGVFGEWEIHCAVVGARRRCALIHRGPVMGDERLDPGEEAIVTHFVIDMVAGRESLLWRLFVPMPPSTVAVASMHAHDVQPATAADDATGVTYRVDGAAQRERFATCGPMGCMMEAGIRHSGSVATRLWEGRSLDVHIQVGGDAPLEVAVPAQGFRAGLKELVRLRREERRPSGRR